MQTLRDKFRGCRRGAAKRNIDFMLTFEQWLTIWQKSGKLHERGCHKGQYVMARFGDIGPYSISNVKIITCSENCSEASKGIPKSDETKRKLSVAHKGKATRLGAKLSEETKNKIRLKALGNTRWLGRHHTEATKRKISQTKRERRHGWGRKHTKATKQKMSIARKKYYENRRSEAHTAKFF